MNELQFGCKALRASFADKFGNPPDISGAKTRRDEYGNDKERLLRALSWHCRAEKAKSEDEKVIFAYVALNALYGKPGDDIAKPGEESGGGEDPLHLFVAEIAKCDGGGLLLEFAKQKKETLDGIISHPFLWKGYWQTLGDEGARRKNWREDQSRVRKNVKKDLQQKRPEYPVRVALSCARVLRNQIMHGSCCCGDGYNRSQMTLCAEFLPPLVGRMIKIMTQNAAGNRFGEVVSPPQSPPDEKPKTARPLPGGKEERNGV